MGGGPGVRTPTLKNHKNIAFLSNSEITKLPSQHSVLGHHQHASETQFKWRLAGPVYSGIWILPPLINLKNVVKVGPPLTKLSGSAHDFSQMYYMNMYFVILYHGRIYSSIHPWLNMYFCTYSLRVCIFSNNVRVRYELSISKEVRTWDI